MILELDDKPVGNIEAFVNAIGSQKPGSMVTLKIFRDGETITKDITLDKHPDDSTKGFLGITISGLIKLSVEDDHLEDLKFDIEEELILPEGDA